MALTPALNCWQRGNSSERVLTQRLISLPRGHESEHIARSIVHRKSSMPLTTQTTQPDGSQRYGRNKGPRHSLETINRLQRLMGRMSVRFARDSAVVSLSQCRPRILPYHITGDNDNKCHSFKSPLAHAHDSDGNASSGPVIQSIREI